MSALTLPLSCSAAEAFPSSSFQAGELPAPLPGELRDCYYNVGSSSCSLLAANTSRQECCCTLGEGWGLGCRYLACPPANSGESPSRGRGAGAVLPGDVTPPDALLRAADFLSLCPSGRGYVTPGEADFSYTGGNVYAYSVSAVTTRRLVSSHDWSRGPRTDRSGVRVPRRPPSP